MREPLETRRELLEGKVLRTLTEPVRYAPPLEADLSILVESVKTQGLEGLVAKRRDSRYERASARVPGRRCGSTAGSSSSLAATRLARRRSMR
jgi:hypothetical protein